ncbi:MAG: hypothetical protein J5711_07525 [Bacteroidales bacterium]|nr:hypothetical protein [Bacteroidales bacterium]
MKKALILSALVLFAGMVFAQRPTTTTRATNTTNTATKINKNANVRTAGATAKTYSYTISEMSIANVTVMDNAATVKQEGKTDKVKVTVNGVSGVSYYLYDANDQAVSKNYINGGNGYVDMSNYQPGEYRLQLIEPKGAEKNYKIIKKQK